MIEYVMSLPLLLGVLVCLFFLGWALMHRQRVDMSSRYAVWRELYDTQTIDVDVDGDAVNSAFFDEKADSVLVDSYTIRPEAIAELVAAAGDMSEGAGALAASSIGDSFPGGLTAGVSAVFEPSITLWRSFAGPISNRHWRDGLEWRRGQVSYLEAIQELFLNELDDAVGRIDDPTLQENIRELYRWRW